MSNKEKAIKMRKCGKSFKEIADELGIAQATVKNYVYGIELEPTCAVSVNVQLGWNKDRSGCRKCIYRNKGQYDKPKRIPGCNFINIVGHSRGCKVENCNVFVKESRKKNG